MVTMVFKNVYFKFNIHVLFTFYLKKKKTMSCARKINFCKMKTTMT